MTAAGGEQDKVLVHKGVFTEVHVCVSACDIQAVASLVEVHLWGLANGLLPRDWVSSGEAVASQSTSSLQDSSSFWMSMQHPRCMLLVLRRPILGLAKGLS